MSYVLHVKANSLSYNQAAQANLLRFPVSSQQKTIAAMNDHGIQVLCLPSCIRRVGYQNTGALERLDLLNNLPLCTINFCSTWGISSVKGAGWVTRVACRIQKRFWKSSLLFQHFNLQDAISYLQSSMGNKFGVRRFLRRQKALDATKNK